MGYEYENQLFRYYNDLEGIITSSVLLLFVTDMVLSTVFIVKGHKSNLKYLRLYHFYSVGLLFITIVLTAVATGLSSQRWLAINEPIQYYNFAGYFINIVLQIYFVVLLKGEIIKVEHSTRFKSMNEPPKSDWTMNYEEQKRIIRKGPIFSNEKEIFKGSPIQTESDYVTRLCDIYL